MVELDTREAAAILRGMIVSKYVKDLTPDEYQDCLQCTFGSIGRMRSELEWCRGNQKRARAIMLVENGELVGWTLVFRETEKKIAHLFVRSEYRRRGYGTQIMKYVARYYRDVSVCPWDSRSSKFYRRFNFECASGYRLGE
jgi:GNAT superfamily N-acetyltransferase